MIGHRPRLVESVGPRRHIVDGVPIIVLESSHTGRGERLEPREWLIVSAADGTRDIDGIALFASACGVYRGIAELRALLSRLQDKELLTDGIALRVTPAATQPAASEPTEAIAPTETIAPTEATGDRSPLPSPDARGEGDCSPRPLEFLPDFSLHCDGSGTCCKFYGTVLFHPDEAIRALALVPEVGVELGSVDHVFLPQYAGGSGGMAVAQIDGACAFLSDRACRIHRAGGASAKPLGCSTYPARLVDDGESVRVSIGIECRCVLDSVGRPGGAPLLPGEARASADVALSGITTLPERIRLTETSTAARSELAAWSRAVLARDLVTDIPLVLWRLASLVERHGLDPTALDALAEMPSFDTSQLRQWMIAAAHRSGVVLSAEEKWRSAKDEARRAVAALHAAATALTDLEALGNRLSAIAPDPASEAFYLRANIHGHLLVGRLPLASALRDRAVRLILAREMGAPELRPLCALEAAMRGYGIRTDPDDGSQSASAAAGVG